MNDRRIVNNSYNSMSDNDDDERRDDDAVISVGGMIRQHRTPRGDDDNNNNNNEHSFGNSSLESNVAYVAEPSNDDDEEEDAEVGRANAADNNNNNKWSPDMRIDENFDINSPVVVAAAAASGGGGHVVVVDQLSPRSTSLQSNTTNANATFLASSPRLTKYLCIASVFLVFCSLGLAAAGLGLIYSSTQRNNDMTSSQMVTPSGSNSNNDNNFDNLDKEVMVSDLDINEDADVIQEEEEDEDDETNAKARLTDAPSMSPTTVLLLVDDEQVVVGDFNSSIITLETTEAEAAVNSTTTSTNATAINVLGNTTQTTTLEQEEEDAAGETNENASTNNNSTATTTTTNNSNSTTANETAAAPAVPLIPDTLHSISLLAIADTFVEYNSTEPYGQVKRLKVDAEPIRTSLLKFNISAIFDAENRTIRPREDVVGYTLRLYSLASSPYGGTIELMKRSCNGWNENNMTWNNAPNCIFQNSSTLVGEFDNVISEYQWNEAVLSMMNDTIFDAEVITLRITSDRADGVMYASRENDTAIPELVVYYTASLTTTATDDPSPLVGENSTTTTTQAPSSSPSPEHQDDVNSTTTSSPSVMLLSTPSISPVPTSNPTLWPTYFPSLSPVSNGTVSPSASPTTTPDDIILPVIQDAMIRGGEYSNSRYGKDPFVALTGLERKAILEFDLGAGDSATDSSLRPNVEYEYTLQMYVSYVAENENDQRSVTASCISPEEEYTWDEMDISWNTFGSPQVNEIGWFTIYIDDMDTLVSIPLGSLSNCTTTTSSLNDDDDTTNNISKKFILVMEIEDVASDGRRDKFDFRSREYGEFFQGTIETPPVLIAVPASSAQV